MLVDEFQDTNPAQLEILKLLVGQPEKGSSFWICGDDWQAIFAFTRASVGNLLSFGKFFPQASQMVLDVNYRSTPQILQACQQLMGHNLKKIDKELTTVNPAGEEIRLINAESEEDETLHLVNEIMTLVGRKQFSYRDLAVLYRTNFQSRVVEEAFAKNKIPYRIEGGQNFFQRHEVRALLDYLALLTNPLSEAGDEALRHIINIPNRCLGRSFLKDLENYSLREGVHLYQGLKTMPLDIPYIKRNVKALVKLIDPLTRKVKKMEPDELLYLLREALDYDRYVTEDEVPSLDDLKLANLNQLQMAAARFSDIGAFLSYTQKFDEETGNDPEGVALMTIHKAKGLEFPVVFLIGLMDGPLPHKHGNLEKERRICFVAMSRAMKLLYVSYSGTYLGKEVEPSPFLTEMGLSVD